jgi:diguanylate cyclase (GGDEF)-like protein
MIIKSSKKRVLYSTISFIIISCAVILKNGDFNFLMPFFIIPVMFLNYHDVEIRFMFLSFIFFISLRTPRLLHLSDISYLYNFLSFLSIVFFSMLKNSVEKKIIIQKKNDESNKLKIKNDIVALKSKIEFYRGYKSRIEKESELREKIIYAIKSIQDSKNNDEVAEILIRSLSYLFPDIKLGFITSSNTSKIAEDIFNSKTAIFIPSTTRETRYSQNQFLPDEKSTIYLAMTAFSKVIAAIKIYSSDENYFSIDDFRTAELLATTASITIENLSMYKTTEELARKDALTGLFTHKAFQEKLDDEILVSARTRQPLAMFIFDIDHFKNVNDIYGHQAGDEVLKKLSSITKTSVREFDFVARYGGEEFVIIMPATDIPKATQIAEALRKNIKKILFNFNGREFRIQVSIGIAEFPKDGTSKSQFIRACDERLYRAKKVGRDRIIYG